MGQANRAAPVRSTVSGTDTRVDSATHTYSANPPCRPWPMPTPDRQRCSRPCRQRSQRPQALVKMLTTWSPGPTVVTPSPTSTTRPASSWPRTIPALTPRRSTPVITSRSWWQNPQAATCTRASPGSGTGTGRSLTTKSGGRPGRSSIRALMTLPLYSRGLAHPTGLCRIIS